MTDHCHGDLCIVTSLRLHCTSPGAIVSAHLWGTATGTSPLLHHANRTPPPARSTFYRCRPYWEHIEFAQHFGPVASSVCPAWWVREYHWYTPRGTFSSWPTPVRNNHSWALPIFHCSSNRLLLSRHGCEDVGTDSCPRYVEPGYIQLLHQAISHPREMFLAYLIRNWTVDCSVGGYCEATIYSTRAGRWKRPDDAHSWVAAIGISQATLVAESSCTVGSFDSGMSYTKRSDHAPPLLRDIDANDHPSMRFCSSWYYSLPYADWSAWHVLLANRPR